MHPKNNLTYNQISEELIKLTNIENQTGFLYFLTNYVFLEHPSGQVQMGENIYSWQINAAQNFLKSRYIISKKPRQVGYSSLTGAYCIWRALFFPSQIISIVSISLRESTTFLRRIKFIYSHLPIWMQQEKIEDQKTSITFKHNNSKINSLPHTDQIARGETLSLLVLDEFAAYKNANDLLASAVPSLAAGSLIKFTNKTIPSQLFLISTYPANPIDNAYVRILNTAREGSSNYLIIDVNTDDIPFYQNQEWLKEQLDLLGPKRYAIEILGEEPIDSDNALLPPNVLQNLKPIPQIRTDYLFNEDVDEEGYPKDLNITPYLKDEFDIDYHYIKTLWIWNDPIKDHEYCITCDVAKGTGGNCNAFIVFDLDTMEQVAEFNNNKVDLETYKKIIEVIARLYNNAKISVENNSMGVGVVEYFVNVINYEGFYFHRKSKRQYDPGFPMNVNTRGPAISYMQSLLINQDITIKSMRLINQLRSFGYDKNGKLQALGDADDDLVMALCQFAYLRNIGFAVSSKKITEELPLGFINVDNNPEEERLENIINQHKGVKKYWEKNPYIDAGDGNRDEMLRAIASSGLSVSKEDMDEMFGDLYE